MRQECTKLTKEVGEKSESLLSAENIRKGLEAKVSAAEKQLSLLQVGALPVETHHVSFKTTPAMISFPYGPFLSLFFFFKPFLLLYLHFFSLTAVCSSCQLVWPKVQAWTSPHLKPANGR